jgi:putative endonuclease
MHTAPAAATPAGLARRRLGTLGEDVAAAHLQAAGLEILDRNWRDGRRGEIDIVAREGQTIVIVEVKTRSSRAFAPPVAAVTWEKYCRLRRLGARWLALHPQARAGVRLDVVEVVLAPGQPGAVTWLRGVYR